MRLLRFVLTVGMASSLFAQTPVQTPAWQPAPGLTTLHLWPQGAPGTKPNAAPEIDTTSAKDQRIAGRPLVRLGIVSTPTLTVYPPKGANSGAAVVVFPGGGYQILAMDLEGTEVCSWLNQRGISCVLLKYRVPNSGPYPKSSVALQDAQRALGIVRLNAIAWHIDPHRVGVLGFSAGGHLAAALSTHDDVRLYPAVDAADQLSCRPDFDVIIYPDYLVLPEQHFAPNPNIRVTSKTPPTLLLQAEDDPVHVENSIVYFMALKNAGVPVEMHIYADGGHGYGLRKTALPITAWPQLVQTWFRTIHVLP